MRVAIYARLSLDQRGDELGVERQLTDLRSELGALADLAAAGRLRVAQLATASAGIEARLADVETRAQKKAPGHPAYRMTRGMDAGVVWAALTVDERRALVGLLAEVRLLPPGRGRRAAPEHVEMPPAGRRPAPR